MWKQKKTRPEPQAIDAPANTYPLCPKRLRELLDAANPPSCQKRCTQTKRTLPVILCIGTDRIVGDSLGPLVGTYLTKMAGEQLCIYGTLHRTVHAQNLHATMQEIKKKHPGHTILAIDASLGLREQIGSVLIRSGSIYPGAGVRKNLPASGDIAITGITNADCAQPYLALQTARLATIVSMAEYISDCIRTACLS